MQEDAQLLSLADQTLWVVALIAGPVLLAALCVGLVVGILSDLMYVFVDPRIDFETREG